MHTLNEFVGRDTRVIGVIRTKCGDHETATVSCLSRLFAKNEEHHIVIRKQEYDPLYEPISEEVASMLGELPKRDRENYLMVRPGLPLVKCFDEVRQFTASQTVADWTSYTPDCIQQLQAQLPNHKVLLTFGGLEIGASDSEFQLCKRLCDVVVLTMFRRDFCSWEAVHIWVSSLSDEQKNKIFIAIWDVKGSEWSQDFFPAAHFASKFEEHISDGTYL